MSKKYKTLRVEDGLQTVALKNFKTSLGEVFKGDFGPVIDSEKNLSQNDLAWGNPESRIRDDAVVTDNAYVFSSIVRGNSSITCDSIIDHCNISGSPHIAVRRLNASNIDCSGKIASFYDFERCCVLGEGYLIVHSKYNFNNCTFHLNKDKEIRFPFLSTFPVCLSINIKDAIIKDSSDVSTSVGRFENNIVFTKYKHITKDNLLLLSLPDEDISFSNEKDAMLFVSALFEECLLNNSSKTANKDSLRTVLLVGKTIDAVCDLVDSSSEENRLLILSNVFSLYWRLFVKTNIGLPVAFSFMEELNKFLSVFSFDIKEQKFKKTEKAESYFCQK